MKNISSDWMFYSRRHWSAGRLKFAGLSFYENFDVLTLKKLKIWRIACNMAVKFLSKQSPHTMLQSQSLELVAIVIVSNVVIGGFSGEDLITGAQPKAGTGHKMQSLSVVFSTLHC